MKNILIIGDSWGCGEWGRLDLEKVGDQFGVRHLGLEQYFEDIGYYVKNMSVAGGRNFQAIATLLTLFKPGDYDYIFWFQTDPLRELHFLHAEYLKENKWFETYDDILKTQNNKLEPAYEKLNSFGQKIYCIGGCSKLNLSLIKDYENLVPLIESVPEFLMPGYKASDVWFTGNWYSAVDENWPEQTIDNLLICKRRIDALRLIPEFKDDAGHPNRHGHKKIFDFILKEILND